MSADDRAHIYYTALRQVRPLLSVALSAALEAITAAPSNSDAQAAAVQCVDALERVIVALDGVMS